MFRSTSLPRFQGLLPYVPYLALIGGILSLSLGTSFAKTLFPVAGPMGTAALRVGLSALILLAVFRPWRHSFTRKDLRGLALYGAVMGLMNLCFYLSLNTIPLGIALAIEFTGPLSVALFNARRPLHFVWVLIAAAGLSLLLPISGGVSTLDPVGCAWAGAAAVFWALYIVYGQRVSHLPSGATVALGMSMAAIVVVPFGAVTAGAALLTPGLLAMGVLVALASSALPYSLDMIALKSIPKRTFGVAVSADPAVGALAGLLLLGEALTFTQWLAIAAVMTASVGTVLTTTREKKKEKLATAAVQKAAA